MSKLRTLQAHASLLGGVCLSDKYGNTNTEYTWRCSEGHTWKATWNNVGGKAKSWCPKCYNARRQAKLQSILNAGEATCLLCRRTKKLDEFPQGHNRINGQQRFSHCKPCHSDYQRARKLRNFFNISIEEYDIVLAFQGGVCALCRNPPKNIRLAIDHDHKTGQVRGLLCPWCNRAIGQFRDDIEKVKRVYDYFVDPPLAKALGGARFGKKGRSTNRAATIARLNAASPILGADADEQQAAGP